MYLTPVKLVLFRTALIFMGPFKGGSKLIRRLLMGRIKKGGKVTYVAHADFLDVRTINKDGRATGLR